jgi:hypothetical protein
MPVADNEFATFEYKIPETLLLENAEKVRLLIQHRDKCGHIPGAERKKLLERYQGGLLGFLIQKMSGPFAGVAVAMHEDSDFDCIIRGIIENKIVYRRVQLKQVPCHQLNPTVTLHEVIGIASKYGDAPDLIVAIWINRDVNFKLADIDITHLQIGQLFLIGDRDDGAVEIHGGTIEDWRRGHVWNGVLQDLQMKVKVVSFEGAALHGPQ